MNGCVIERDGMLAAGALLSPGTSGSRRGSCGAGRPRPFMRDLDDRRSPGCNWASRTMPRMPSIHKAALEAGDGASPKLISRLPLRFARLADGEGRLALRVTPGARSEGIELGDGRIAGEGARPSPRTARPTMRCCELLAKALGTATSRLRMLRGATGRDKLVQLDG
jgi:uncharacterized protein YggU (UPF0235/DUF167 family)